MSIQSVNQMLLDQEEHWKKRADTWLEDFKKTDLYKQMEQEYEPVTFAAGIKNIADARTRYYRYGPGYMLARQKKQYEYIQLAFECFRAIQQKKWFDLEVKWLAGLINIEGCYFPCQGSDLPDTHAGKNLITDLGQQDLRFLKSLLADNDFINSREDIEDCDIRPDSELTEWLEEWNEWDEEEQEESPFPENYPIMYQKYDEWHNQQDLITLPQKRLEKFEEYMEVHRKVKYPERYSKPPESTTTDAEPESTTPEPVTTSSATPAPATTEISNDFDPSKQAIYYDKLEKFTRQWFETCEPAEMHRCYLAYMEFCHREKSTDFMEFYESVQELAQHPVKPYPDGSVGWLDALIRLGLKIRYEKISDVLDMAFDLYKEGLLQGIDYTKKEKRFLQFNPEEAGENGHLFLTYKERLFAAQESLGEPQILEYWKI